MTRSLIGGVVVTAAILGCGIMISDARLAATFAESRTLAREDLAIVTAAHRLMERVEDLETGERGFLLSGDPAFLQPYVAARAELPAVITSLRAHLGADAHPRADVERIAAAIDRWHRQVGDPEIAARRAAAAEGAAPPPADRAADTGKRIVDAIRADFDHLLADEAVAREAGQARLEANRRRAEYTIASSTALAAGVALGLGLLVSLQLRRGVSRLIVASERIAAGDFAAPIGTERGELARLAESLRSTAGALAQRGREAEALIAIGRSAKERELDALLGAMRAALVPVIDVKAAWFMSIERDEIVAIAADPPQSAPAEARGPLGGTAVAEAIAQRRLVVVRDVADDRYRENAQLRRLGARGLVVMPMTREQEPDGAIAVLVRDERTLTPDLERFSELVCQQISGIVQTARLTRELAQRNQELERATRAKSEFLAMMSHELRTPLNSIIGFSDVLVDQTFGALNERQGRYVRNINDSGRHLLRLINDLLDVSKIEAGRLEVLREPCSPRALVLEVLSALQPLAEQKRITLRPPADDAPPPVIADPVRLKQVLYNLVSNAIKFTPPAGAIGVELAVVAEGRDLRITVSDSGAGIAAEDLVRLFQPFSQLDNARHDPRAGTGLGLALTKQLVELMNGRVGVESEPGKGSRFSIELRVAPKRSAPSSSNLRLGSRAPLALIVDDDPAARELLQLTLQGAQFRCVAVGSGSEALLRAAELRPDVVLLDIFLPGMDGWDVLRALREDPRTSAIPVVLVTISNDRHTSFTLGAVDHLVKPVSAEALLTSLARHGFTTSAKQRPLRVLVVDDDPSHCELMRAALEPRGFVVQTALTGAEGISLARAGGFDLLLLDLVIPDVSGVDVVAALRSDEATRQLPIVLVTANQLTTSDRQRLSGSVSAILSKAAMGSDQLLAEVRRAVGEAG